MCEQADAVSVLKNVPFSVAALEHATQPGSYERSLVRSVYKAVRADIEWAVQQIEAERKAQGAKR